MTAALLEVVDVSQRFVPQLSIGEKIAARFGSAIETRTVHAVDSVSLSIRKGEVLGLAGESGCGKSTLGRAIAGILPPSGGRVLLDGKPVMDGTGRRARKTTTRVQMVFQDPFASLDPRMRIGEMLLEGPLAHGLVTRDEAEAYGAHWLTAVGLDPDVAQRFPHQFSGGQRQRVAIARALAMQPDLLICDEPVASLDVSIQAQIINLFLKLRRELGLTMLFISHDLGIVRHISDRVAIMYLGRIVETGATRALYAHPRHPYTRALLDSVPQLRLDETHLATFKPIQGELPSPLSPPPGCHFHLRCTRVASKCRTDVPVLQGDVTDQSATGHAVSGHSVACHLPL